MKIIMLGAPGAGKGTQADMICSKYNVPHISTGDIFRANIKNGTELGQKAKGYMDRGELVPDSLVVDLVIDRIHQDDAKNGYVLDGFPRTIPQAEALDAALAAEGDSVDYAINVDVPDDNIVNRMSGRRACVKCGATYHVKYNAPKTEGVCDNCGSELIQREDDKPETVLNRLSVYHKETQPLIDYYSAKGLVKNIDGTKDLNDVFADAIAMFPQSEWNGGKAKFYYISQVGVEPPTFAIFVNDPNFVHFSYMRYLENQLRKNFDFFGTPIKLELRKRD